MAAGGLWSLQMITRRRRFKRVNPARALLEFRGDPIQSWPSPPSPRLRGDPIYCHFCLNQFFIIVPRPCDPRASRGPPRPCGQTTGMRPRRRARCWATLDPTPSQPEVPRIGLPLALAPTVMAGPATCWVAATTLRSAAAAHVDFSRAWVL